jgi:hypothetical protein
MAEGQKKRSATISVMAFALPTARGPDFVGAVRAM